MTLRSCKYVLCKKHFMIIICLDDRDCQQMRFIVDSQFYTNYPHFTRCAEIYGIYALPHMHMKQIEKYFIPIYKLGFFVI